MKIDRTEAICGVSPAILKRLINREYFSTLTAMADLKLAEPWVSETLIALMREGWIEPVRSNDHVDHWRSSDQGNRLAATRLIKRFPVREGRAIVKRAAAEARLINADQESSCRIAEILLFGSVLTGADDDDAGDIDLVVKVARRQLPETELKRLQQAEKAQMPPSLDFFQRQFRVENQLLRRIKKVSLLPLIEPVSDLAWQWLDRMRPYCKGLGLAVGTGFFAEQGPEPLENPRPVDFRPLVLPLYDLLRAQLPANLDRYAVYDHRLMVDLSQPFRIDHWDGEPSYGNAKRRRVRKADASRPWDALTALFDKFRPVLEGGELFTVTAFGREIAESDE